jgi:hypothetical protein
MRARAQAASRLALASTAMTVALAIGGIVFLALSWDAPLPDSWGFRGYGIIHAIGFTTVGAVVALRRPANAIGWLLLGAGFISAVGSFGLEYSVYAIVGRAAPLPGGAFGAWLGSWTWVLFITGILPYLLLLFPDGRLPSARWWPVGWVAVAAMFATAAFMAFNPGPLQLAAQVNNPFTPLPPSLVSPLAAIGIALGFPAMGGACWSLVLRFRRSTGVEREQIKWLALSAVPLAAAGLASAVLPDKVGQVLFVFLLLSVPIAVGVAVLRYRLYDIDLLINRTLVYGATSAAIGATFFVGIIALQTLLRPLTAGSELSVAISTLASFALFQPIRRRVQDTVDRHFDRSRYDAARTLDAFADQLRDEVDLDDLRSNLLGAVQQTMAPTHASLWLRERAR